MIDNLRPLGQKQREVARQTDRLIYLEVFSPQAVSQRDWSW
jgi:hypothetical protein